jgi:hypothetical protein
MRGTNWTAEEVSELKRLLRLGNNSREAADVLGRTRSSVRNMVFKLRLPYKNKDNRLYDRWMLIIDDMKHKVRSDVVSIMSDPLKIVEREMDNAFGD